MTGTLLPIGGAEDNEANPLILQRFVALCGGTAATIVVIPSASSIPVESAAEYTADFLRFGAQRVITLPISRRTQADDQCFISDLAGATGIFFTGGDQVQLLALIGDTACSRQVMACFQAGIPIGGTSAGASAMSQHMIGSGYGGIMPSAQLVEMATGLGIAPNVIIDQHFAQRVRLGRLMAAVIQHPDLIGVGLDEDTALLMPPSGLCEVVGSGGVTLVLDSHHPANNQVMTGGHVATPVGCFMLYHLSAGAHVRLPHPQHTHINRRF